MLCVLAITSCNKEVTCDCTYTYSTGGVVDDSQTVVTSYESTDGCDGYESSVTSDNITVATSCVEK